MNRLIILVTITGVLYCKAQRCNITGNAAIANQYNNDINCYNDECSKTVDQFADVAASTTDKLALIPNNTGEFKCNCSEVSLSVCM